MNLSQNTPGMPALSRDLKHPNFYEVLMGSHPVGSLFWKFAMSDNKGHITTMEQI